MYPWLLCTIFWNSNPSFMCKLLLSFNSFLHKRHYKLWIMHILGCKHSCHLVLSKIARTTHWLKDHDRIKKNRSSTKVSQSLSSKHVLSKNHTTISKEPILASNTSSNQIKISQSTHFILENKTSFQLSRTSKTYITRVSSKTPLIY